MSPVSPNSERGGGGKFQITGASLQQQEQQIIHSYSLQVNYYMKHHRFEVQVLSLLEMRDHRSLKNNRLERDWNLSPMR